MQGLRGVTSLAQLVGAYHLTPDPVGPPVTGFDGAVIGDSRAVRVGGPPVPDGTPDDAACQRSTDSLAAEIGHLLPARVLNLACPSATVTSGLRGPQDAGGRSVPAAGRRPQAGAGAAVRRGGDRPERRGLDRLPPLLLRRPRLLGPPHAGRVRLPAGGVRPRLRRPADRPQRAARPAAGDRHDVLRRVPARRRLRRHPRGGLPRPRPGQDRAARPPATTSSTACSRQAREKYGFAVADPSWRCCARRAPG